MRVGRKLSGLLTMLLLGWGQQAHALLNVGCSVSASATSFGVYNPFNATPQDTTGSVTVSCQGLLGLPIHILEGYTIALSTGSSGSYATRQLVGPGYQLQYNLYTDPGRTSVWGDGSNGTAVLSHTTLLELFPYDKTYTIYGRIAAGQNVPPGSYTDTIIVTIDYY